MATAEGVTATEKAAPVTDEQQTRNILSQYGIRVDEEDAVNEDYITSIRADFEDGELYLWGYDSLTLTDEETGEDHVPVLLDELRDVLAGELVIRSSTHAKCRWIAAYQYRVTPDAVYYGELASEEKRVDVDRETRMFEHVTDREPGETRHVAAVVFTHALSADVDLVLETLDMSDFIQVNREGPHFADVVIDQGDADE